MIKVNLNDFITVLRNISILTYRMKHGIRKEIGFEQQNAVNGKCPIYLSNSNIHRSTEVNEWDVFSCSNSSVNEMYLM